MIGIDIVKISRIENIIQKRGLEFAQKMIGSSANNVETLAGHFALKEAFGKALGTGLTIDILNNAHVDYHKNGRPFLNYNGKRYFASISHDGEYAVANIDIRNFIADQKYLELLNKRPENSNKSTFGRLGIVAGYNNMPGSAILATKAAFRVGSGYVYLYSNEKLLPIFQNNCTEAIVGNLDEFCNRKHDAILIGPGIGFNLENEVQEIFKIIEENQIPTIVDADGFYYLKKHGLKTKLILTPHPKEASRLLDVDVDFVLANREGAAKAIAEKYNSICILKGNNSLIADPKHNIIVNRSGSNALATAGTGDVLAGMIGGFLAQGMDAKSAAIAGAYFHGIAADIFSHKYSKRSMMAGDLIDMLKYVFRGEDYA